MWYRGDTPTSSLWSHRSLEEPAGFGASGQSLLELLLGAPSILMQYVFPKVRCRVRRVLGSQYERSTGNSVFSTVLRKTSNVISTKLFIVLLVLAGASSGQTPINNEVMSHEEAVVRGAYAKLSCAAKIGYYWHGIDNESDPFTRANPRSVVDADQELRFELSHLQVGQLASISSLPWTSLVSGPINVLHAEYHELPASRPDPPSKEMFASGYADVTWNSRSHEDVSDLAKLNQGVTVAEYVNALQQPTTGEAWIRYATYQIRATLGEHAVSYRATFLFAGNGRTEEVWPLDYATGMTVAPFIKARVCATNAANTLLRQKPVVEAKLLDNESCRWLNSRGEEYCDSSDRSQMATRNADRFTLPCAIDACNKTADRLPSHCPSARQSYSEKAGTLFNTTTDSLPQFDCTWICVHEARPEWRERHGPWALLSIDGSPVSEQSVRAGESGGDQKR